MFPRVEREKWVPDETVSHCIVCTAPFGLMRAKHHCRCCGRIACSSCLVNKPYKYGVMDKTCKECIVVHRIKRDDAPVSSVSAPAEAAIPQDHLLDSGWVDVDHRKVTSDSTRPMEHLYPRENSKHHTLEDQEAQLASLSGSEQVRTLGTTEAVGLNERRLTSPSSVLPAALPPSAEEAQEEFPGEPTSPLTAVQGEGPPPQGSLGSPLGPSQVQPTSQLESEGVSASPLGPPQGQPAPQIPPQGVSASPLGPPQGQPPSMLGPPHWQSGQFHPQPVQWPQQPMAPYHDVHYPQQSFPPMHAPYPNPYPTAPQGHFAPGPYHCHSGQYCPQPSWGGQPPYMDSFAAHRHPYESAQPQQVFSTPTANQDRFTSTSSAPPPAQSSILTEPPSLALPGAADDDAIASICEQMEIKASYIPALRSLLPHDVAIIVDDSGSMAMQADCENPMTTRWLEVRRSVEIIIKVAAVMGKAVDVYFLNRGVVRGATSFSDIAAEFSRPPRGMTNTLAALGRLWHDRREQRLEQRPLVVHLFTDGHPTDDHGHEDINSFAMWLRNRENIHNTFIAILLCTQEEEVCAAYRALEYRVRGRYGWNGATRGIQGVDVTEDFRGEKQAVMARRGPRYSFSFGDYVVKCLVGAIDPQVHAIDLPPGMGIY